MLTLDATYPGAQRNRLTVFFRSFIAIPHLVVAGVWGWFAEILAIPQWFIVVFTGKRNQGIYDMQRAWLDYNARVATYLALQHDVFPPFGSDAGTVPVRVNLTYEESGNRLTTGLRFLWAIPAMIIIAVIGIAAYVVIIISWFAILFTGTQSEGMWTFVNKLMQMSLRLQAYVLLMSDTYPSYN